MSSYIVCDIIFLIFLFMATILYITVQATKLDQAITYLYYLIFISPILLYYTVRIISIIGKKIIKYYNRNKLENEIEIEIVNHSNLY